jgi:CRP-like cAMP-binding protein
MAALLAESTVLRTADPFFALAQGGESAAVGGSRLGAIVHHQAMGKAARSMDERRKGRTAQEKDGPARPADAGSSWIERSTRSGLLQGLNPAEIASIAGAAQRRRVARGASFFRQGSPASSLHLLTLGRAKLVRTTAEGHQVLVRIVGPGDMFGGGALVGDAVYPATAEALDVCEAIAWSGDALTRLMGRFPKLAMNALRVLATRMQELQERYQELATERVEQRVARAVLRLARQVGRKEAGGILIDMALSRQDLAELTGTTVYTVSRIVSGWQDQGLVEAGRSRLVIRQGHRLVAIAEDLPPHAAARAASRD